MRPRVWFGERWINSVFDLFEENVRYFPALLPITEEEDPVAVLESGGTPQLAELRLHNGTIYRWNRPVYDIAGRRARTCGSRTACCPPDPTVADTDGQRRVLLRAGAGAGRERAAAVVADVVQRRRGELPRRRRARHRRRDLLARRRPGPGHRADPAPAAAAGQAGPGRVGRAGARSRPAARDHRAALPDRDERRGVVRPPDGRPPGRRSGSTRCGTCCWSTASGCTPTSRCTPGTDRR